MEAPTLVPNRRAAPARLGVPPPRGRLPAKQPDRMLLPRTDDSTPRETWGFHAPPTAAPPRPAPGALARRPRPRPAISCPLAEGGCVSAWLHWEGSKDLGHVLSQSRRLPQTPRKRPRAAAAAAGRFSRPAGSGSGAASWAGRSSAGRRVALPVPARRGGRTRVSASRPRAPPGLASAAAPEAGGPGLSAQQSAAGGGHTARPRAPKASATPGAAERICAVLSPPSRCRSGPRPRSSDWAPWRCPGARHPRGAHRLDPGGPAAAGRRPQVHGGLGAR